MNLLTGEDDRIDKVLGKLHKAFESQTKFNYLFYLYSESFEISQIVKSLMFFSVNICESVNQRDFGREASQPPITGQLKPLQAYFCKSGGEYFFCQGLHRVQ